MLFTYKGSIPSELPEGVTMSDHINAGWVPVVQPKPVESDGKEVVWLNWQWVLRDVKPEDREGYQWNWNHASLSWVECELPGAVIEDELEDEPGVISGLESGQLSQLTTDQISAL